MSRQIAAAIQKIALTPANVIRGVPVKAVGGPPAVKVPTGVKLGWKNWWPPEYKTFNPRLMPYGYTSAACFRLNHWGFYWEHIFVWRLLFYSSMLTYILAYYIDFHIFGAPGVKEALTAMVADDLKAQREALYAHVQKHEDHAYFKHKGCHDDHPHDFGVHDVHVL